MTRPRITPNFFAISFGIGGLAQTWTTAARLTSAPQVVADGLWLVDAVVWVATFVLYLRSLGGGRWRVELGDHVFGPFVSVPFIVGMLLAGGLRPHLPTVALVLYVTSLVAALVLAGHLLATWALDTTPATQWHPGYYLPSVGAPLVGAAEAGTFGHPTLARLLFGFGAISWLLLGGILLHHLIGQQRLPAALLPTMAIMLAPPVVAGNAWFAIDGGKPDTVALALAGYALLMAIVQLGLVPAYRTAPFGAGWWSFSFPYAATTGYTVTWLAAERVPLRGLWTAVLLAVITAFIGYLAVRTVLAVRRGTFLPQRVTGGARVVVTQSEAMSALTVASPEADMCGAVSR